MIFLIDAIDELYRADVVREHTDAQPRFLFDAIGLLILMCFIVDMDIGGILGCP